MTNLRVASKPAFLAMFSCMCCTIQKAQLQPIGKIIRQGEIRVSSLGICSP